MALENNLVTYLEGQAAVLALIGNDDSPETIRCYPVVAPQNVTMPMIVYQRVSGERSHNLLEADGRAMPTIQIDIFSDSYSEVKAVADALRGALDGYEGTVGALTIDRITLLDEIDSWDDDTDYFRIIQDYNFSYLE